MREDGSDPAALMAVGDLERDLRGGPVANEPRDPDRLRVAVDVGHEDVAVAVDAGERGQLDVRQARLRAAETSLARARAKALEVRRDRGGIPAETNGDSPLTRRETEVLRLIAVGLSNREIASSLVLSEHTVHRHVANILRKLTQSSRAATATQATRAGYI